jgi:hypothetical protein
VNPGERAARGPGALATTAWGATLVYAVLAVVLTWPLAPRAARDVPGDLLDPLFSCWALGWNFHAMGLSPGGPPASYWDANIFHPTGAALARSEHFFPQAVQGALVFALTRSVLVTYNALVLSTFVLSGLFLFLLARDETGDPRAALLAGLLYAFALFRWTQIAHLGGLSSQWMPAALLLARRVARHAPTAPAPARRSVANPGNSRASPRGNRSSTPPHSRVISGAVTHESRSADWSTTLARSRWAPPA